MEDTANDATEPEESAAATAEPRETEGDPGTEPGAQPGASGKGPSRFLARLGWTVGRGVGALADGTKWVGGGLQSLSPDSSEIPPDEGANEGSDAEEPATAEGEQEVEETTKKSKKKSKKE